MDKQAKIDMEMACLRELIRSSIPHYKDDLIGAFPASLHKLTLISPSKIKSNARIIAEASAWL